MKKYYLMAIEKGVSSAMNNLGNYYCDVKKNYDKMKKYYLMAVEKGDSSAMNNLGNYYNVKKNYDKMKKYYLMAIEKNHCNAAYNLGHYYHIVEINYDEMEKYYMEAINRNNLQAYCLLRNYYLNHHLDLELLQLYIRVMDINIFGVVREIIIKRFNMIVGNKLLCGKKLFLELVANFIFCENDDIHPLLKILQNIYNDQISLMDLHFKYTVNGIGFEDAKNDFINKCISNI
jgi:tetratricopeptide (TPR) repeat protein